MNTKLKTLQCVCFLLVLIFRCVLRLGRRNSISYDLTTFTKSVEVAKKVILPYFGSLAFLDPGLSLRDTK